MFPKRLDTARAAGSRTHSVRASINARTSGTVGDAPGHAGRTRQPSLASFASDVDVVRPHPPPESVSPFGQRLPISRLGEQVLDDQHPWPIALE
jgi:hypothetical protein